MKNYYLYLAFIFLCWTIFIGIIGYQTHLKIQHNVDIYFNQIRGEYE